MITEKIEMIKSVRSRQVIWLEWHQQATEGLTDDDLIISITRKTPFGDYLIGMVRP